MTDTPHPDDDDLVGQVVERAADKVAGAVPPPIPGLRRREAFVALAVIFIMLVTDMFLDIQARNESKINQHKIEAACKIAVLSEGAQSANATALRLADCLR